MAVLGLPRLIQNAQLQHDRYQTAGSPVLAFLDDENICIQIYDVNDETARNTTGYMGLEGPLTTEKLLLLVRIITDGALESAYDTAELSISSLREASSDATTPEEWIWVAHPYWALMYRWFYTVFTFGKRSDGYD